MLAIALAVLAGAGLFRMLVPDAPAAPPSQPSGLAQARAATDWTQVQARFGLSDLAVLDAQQLLASSPRFEKGHLLHDLAAYPGGAERAFRLIAANPDLGRLTDQLRGLAIGSRPFPDIALTGSESQHSADTFADLVVLSIVERFSEQRSDPRVGRVLAALRNNPLPGPAQGQAS